MELLRGDRLGKYEILGRVAAGGMAEVYLARSIGAAGFAKTVALKRMLPELASEPGFREMFMQEAALAARLNHPNIVQIFDFAEERGELYIAMEFVHGMNLRRVIVEAASRSGPKAPRVTPLLAAHIGRCIARALAHAWQVPDEQGKPSHLIHRDVSPQNILLSYEGDPKLADFGIAKPAERRTSVGVVKGKLLYMAPEQLLAGALDARTDVFALGIVMYEAALNRRTPLFEASCEDAVKAAVQSRLVPPPERMDPDFPPSLAAVIMKALERDPLRRYQSAAELADALGEAIHREAKGPQDCDLAGLMRRLYGEAPLIKGLAPDAPEPTPRSAGAKPATSATADSIPVPVATPPPAAPNYRSELERIADDPLAATVSREQAEALRAAPPRPEAEARTRAERRSPKAEAGGSPVVAEGARSLARFARRRWPALAVGAAFLAAGVAALTLREAPQAAPAPTLPSTAAHAAADAPSKPPGPAAEGKGAAEHAAAVDPAPLAPSRPSGASPARANAKASPAAAPPVPAAARAETPVAAPAATPAEKRLGTLVVYVRPWVFAWIDGEEFTGRSNQEAAPLLRRRVLAGRHVVHLQDPLGNRRDVPVVVTADRELRVEGTFERTTVR